MITIVWHLIRDEKKKQKRKKNMWAKSVSSSVFGVNFPSHLIAIVHPRLIDSNGNAKTKDIDYNKSNIFHTHPIKLNWFFFCVRQMYQIVIESWNAKWKKAYLCPISFYVIYAHTLSVNVSLFDITEIETHC